MDLVGRVMNSQGGNALKHRISRWIKLGFAAGLATLGSSLVITTSFAQSSADCRAYAEDYSYRYSADSVWGEAFRVGGRRAGATAIAANRSRSLQRSTLFDRAYARCMRGLWP